MEVFERVGTREFSAILKLDRQRYPEGGSERTYGRYAQFCAAGACRGSTRSRHSGVDNRGIVACAHTEYARVV